MASITSAGSGNWASGGTWSGGVSPGAGDSATITTGHDVTITADTVIGDGSNSTVLTVGGPFVYTGTLTITGAKLTIRGNATFGTNYLGDGPFSPQYVARVTIASTSGHPAGIELDGNAGVTPVVQVGQISRITATGTAADRCYLRTKSGTAGDPGHFVGYGNGTAGLQADLQYCDLSRLGDSSTAGFGSTGLSYAGAKFAMDHCAVDHCGLVPFVLECVGDSVFSLTRSVWTNCLDSGGLAMRWYTSTARTTGTRVVSYNVFSAAPKFDQPQDLTIDHNYLGEDLQAGHLFPGWASFDGNFVRKTALAETITSGDISNSYFLYDPAGDGSHGFTHCSGYQSTTHAGNVYQYTGTGAVANVAVTITEADLGARVVTIKNCIVLPQSGSSSVPLSQAFNSPDDSHGVQTVAEHNTVAVGAIPPIPLYSFSVSSSPLAERANQLLSNRANIYWRTGAAPGTGLTIISNASSYNPVVDAAAAVNNDYNARTAFDTQAATQWTVTTPVTSATTISDGTPYNSPMSGATAPGAHDVAFGNVASVTSAGPKFADPTRDVAAWDLSLGGPGTIANALAKLRLQYDSAAGGYDVRYTTAALLAYVRAGFRPTNAALNGATYPGDAATLDAAGNALTGTIGAMAFQAAATGGVGLSGPGLCGANPLISHGGLVS